MVLVYSELQTELELKKMLRIKAVSLFDAAFSFYDHSYCLEQQIIIFCNSELPF